MTGTASMPQTSALSTEQHRRADLEDCGRQLRDEGLAVAEDATEPGWRQRFDELLGARAATGEPFQVAQLAFEDGLDEPPSPAHWGAALRSAHRAGRIEAAGYVQSMRPETHLSMVRLWRGVTR